MLYIGIYWAFSHMSRTQVPFPILPNIFAFFGLLLVACRVTLVVVFVFLPHNFVNAAMCGRSEVMEIVKPYML